MGWEVGSSPPVGPGYGVRVSCAGSTCTRRYTCVSSRRLSSASVSLSRLCAREFTIVFLSSPSWCGRFHRRGKVLAPPLSITRGTSSHHHHHQLLGLFICLPFVPAFLRIVNKRGILSTLKNASARWEWPFGIGQLKGDSGGVFSVREM